MTEKITVYILTTHNDGADDEVEELTGQAELQTTVGEKLCRGYSLSEMTLRLKTRTISDTVSVPAKLHTYL